MTRALARRLTAALIAGGALAPAAALAQDDVVLFQDVPTAAELDAVLFGGEPATTRGLGTRAVRFHRESAPAAQAAAAPPAQAADAPSARACDVPGTDAPANGTALGFNLLFAFDSIEMLGDSEQFLDRLGEVLSQPKNAEKVLLVRGHTDATGGECYNLDLSQARARAARDYLVSAWRVAPERLEVEGLGEARLLPEVDPADGLNRRVEFLARN
jgi:outer membrane protein OmpA-like peptidoglycan-associated protein